MRTVRPAIITKSVKVPANVYFQIREIALSESKLILNIMQEALEDYVKKHNKGRGK